MLLNHHLCMDAIRNRLRTLKKTLSGASVKHCSEVKRYMAWSLPLHKYQVDRGMRPENVGWRWGHHIDTYWSTSVNLVPPDGAEVSIPKLSKVI